MSSAPKCSFLLGKDLKKEQLEHINNLRVKEFNSEKMIDPKPDNEDYEKVFILLESDKKDKLLAFCRLHKVQLKFGEFDTEVIGFDTLIASEKRKGYGSKIIDCAKYYSESEKKAILGFCNPNLEDFYKKSGFKLVDGGVVKFVYTNENNQVVPPTYPESIAFIYDVSESLYRRVNEFHGKIHISMRHW